MIQASTYRHPAFCDLDRNPASATMLTAYRTVNRPVDPETDRILNISLEELVADAFRDPELPAGMIPPILRRSFRTNRQHLDNPCPTSQNAKPMPPAMRLITDS